MYILLWLLRSVPSAIHRQGFATSSLSLLYPAERSALGSYTQPPWSSRGRSFAPPAFGNDVRNAASPCRRSALFEVVELYCRLQRFRLSIPYILFAVLPLWTSHVYLLRATCPSVAFEGRGVLGSTFPTPMLLLELHTRHHSPAPPDFSCYGHCLIFCFGYLCFRFALYISCILSSLHYCAYSVRIAGLG